MRRNGTGLGVKGRLRGEAYRRDGRARLIDTGRFARELDALKGAMCTSSAVASHSRQSKKDSCVGETEQHQSESNLRELVVFLVS